MALGDAPTLIEHVRSYLVAENIVRVAKQPGDPDVPCWLSPKNGTPMPNEGDDPAAIVVGLYQVQGVVTDRHEGFHRIPAVDFRINAAHDPMARDLEQQIYAALHDKRNWQMADQLVNESLQYLDLALIGTGPDGYEYRMQYLFDLWAPDAP